MKVLPDPNAVAWLMHRWDLSLEWDIGNNLKLQKHGLTVADVESVFDGITAFAGRIESSTGESWGENRYLTLGKVNASKIVTIVWTQRGNKLRPISVRASRPNERTLYEKAIG